MDEISHESNELIKAILENAAIGKQTLCRLIKRSADPTMRNALAKQFAEYHELHCEAEKLLGNAGGSARIPRAPIFASLAINLGVDATSTHMAEMVIQGCTMGMVDIKRQLRELPGADGTVKELANKLFETERANLTQMLDYV